MHTEAATHAKTTAARSVVSFVDDEGNDVVYNTSPMTDRDIAEIDEWLQCRVNELAMKACRNCADASERREMLTAAALSAGSVSCTTAEGARMLATIDGWARLTWQAIHRNHPNVSPDDLRKLMTNPANIEKADANFRRLNVGTKSREPELKKAEPVKNRRERRKAKSKSRKR